MEKPNDVNESQWQAISHEGNHLLIVAGPGTGKTHTLTRRIARLTPQLSGQQKILAITFTNKAADEMRERLEGLTESMDAIDVGTFHWFCLKILRQYIEATNLPKDFRVAPPNVIAKLAKEYWADNSDKERRGFLEHIARFKSNLDEEVPDEVRPFNQFLREHKFIDFDDILRETIFFLRRNVPILQQIRKTYRYVCVDEYQDINAVQQELLMMLVKDGVQMTAIGDPNQAIYGFRGSDVSFFEDFENVFTPATKLFLSDNYRSTTNLLTASSQVIKVSGGDNVPDLVAKIIEEGRLTVYQAPTDKAEAEYVVHQIEKLIGGTSMFSQDSGRVDGSLEGEYSFGDIAVLYRLNSQSILLQEAFGRSGIPYQVARKKKEVDEEVLDGTIDDLSALDQKILRQNEDSVDVKAERVSLMSIHAAKGLEFPVVFMIGCEEHLIPLDYVGMTSEVQEERRLFYVGMTRAKQVLYLLRAKKRRLYGKTLENNPSRFLSDIEESLKAYEVAKTRRKPKKQEDQQLQLF